MTAASPRTPADAIRWAAVTMTPRLAGRPRIAPLDEPKWFDGNTLPRLALGAGFSNEPQILTAYAVPGRAFDDLPKVRNFYAHRSQHTARTAKTLIRQYGLPAGLRAGEIAGHPHPSRPGSIAEYWLAQMVATVRLLPH